jgi:hypothetical protein
MINRRVSLFQNFVCTSEERLEVLRNSLPILAKVINPYPVFVNYDTLVNAKEVEELYKEHIENLYFQTDIGKDWAMPIKHFLSISDSERILYLCEDMVFDENYTHEKFNALLDESDSLNSSHLLMGKVIKYMNPDRHSNSTKNKLTWSFHASKSPYRLISCDAVFERNLFESIVSECVGKGLKGLDSFEFTGMHHRDIICTCPTDPIIVEIHPNGKVER